MSGLVGYLLLFLMIGVGFILINLVVGHLVRPVRPNPEKLTIYECGEPTIGSAWVQCDLRFYVVALLLVIFAVEVAFFFPCAVVFGQANALAKPEAATPGQVEMAHKEFLQSPAGAADAPGAVREEQRAAARQYAWLAFFDILFFFGVLLVGFAYLWKRGDLDWVRSLSAQRAAARPAPSAGVVRPREQLVVLTKD